MSGGEKSQLLKKNCWQKVVENWDTCKKKKKFFTIFLQHFLHQIWVLGCYGILLVEQKSYFSGRFKLEPIKNSHIWFVVKVLRKYCERSTFIIYIYIK